MALNFAFQKPSVFINGCLSNRLYLPSYRFDLVFQRRTKIGYFVQSVMLLQRIDEAEKSAIKAAETQRKDAYKQISELAALKEIDGASQAFQRRTKIGYFVQSVSFVLVNSVQGEIFFQQRCRTKGLFIKKFINFVKN